MLSARHDFWKGFWGALPFCFVVGPYGMVFGVLAAESGLNIFTSIAFSLAVIAGAAQFTALSLMHDQAPTIVVIIVGLTVNLRMALYFRNLSYTLGQSPILDPCSRGLFDLGPQLCSVRRQIPKQS